MGTFDTRERRLSIFAGKSVLDCVIREAVASVAADTNWEEIGNFCSLAQVVEVETVECVLINDSFRCLHVDY